jgi:hypothetical protein
VRVDFVTANFLELRLGEVQHSPGRDGPGAVGCSGGRTLRASRDSSLRYCSYCSALPMLEKAVPRAFTSSMCLRRSASYMYSCARLTDPLEVSLKPRYPISVLVLGLCL